MLMCGSLLLRGNGRDKSRSPTRPRTRFGAVFTAAVAALALFSAAPHQPVAQAAPGSPAIPPPLGWNSWNSFGCNNVNETAVRQAADAMVNSGMRDAGYQYVVVDDCW